MKEVIVKCYCDNCGKQDVAYQGTSPDCLCGGNFHHDEVNGIPEIVFWVSRHQMSNAQLNGLMTILNRPFEVIQKDIVWQATVDEKADYEANRKTWRLLSEVKFLAGVFPPVALEAKPSEIVAYTPISGQTKRTEAGSEGKIEFVHLRWAKV